MKQNYCGATMCKRHWYDMHEASAELISIWGSLEIICTQPWGKGRHGIRGNADQNNLECRDISNLLPEGRLSHPGVSLSCSPPVERGSSCPAGQAGASSAETRDSGCFAFVCLREERMCSSPASKRAGAFEHLLRQEVSVFVFTPSFQCLHSLCKIQCIWI